MRSVDSINDLIIALEEAQDVLNGAPNTVGLHCQISSALESGKKHASNVAAAFGVLEDLIAAATIEFPPGLIRRAEEILRAEKSM